MLDQKRSQVLVYPRNSAIAVAGIALVSFWCSALLAVSENPTAKPSVADLEFFETSVRPLLHNACSNCHGTKTEWGGLRVDSIESLLRGGDTGPAIVPGDADASLLIQSVRRTGDYEMPPENPLSPEEVAILEKWISMGAPWPNEPPPSLNNNDKLAHWAFQPIEPQNVPELLIDSNHPNQSERPLLPIDAFVRRKLQEQGLDLLPNADKRTLARRLYYSLTGLPPTLEEMERFIADDSPDAYEKLVDRLLDSTQYGEHWARYWLDLARYADTKGYVYAFESSAFLHSAPYRDWVVKAFQEDMPYDQFLLMQIAADQVPDQSVETALEHQAAMGFMTLNRRFLGNEHDIIDDRLDVLGRTTMGLTFGCARCHDHKYDPIPIGDYYSLYGVIGNSIEELYPLQPIESLPDELQAEYRKRLEAYQEVFTKHATLAAERMRGRIGDYLKAQLDLASYPNIPFSQILQESDLYPAYVHQWDAFLRETAKRSDPIFSAWHALLAIDEPAFEPRAREITQDIENWDSDKILPAVAAIFQSPPQSREEVVQRYSDLFQGVVQEWEEMRKIAVESGAEPPIRLPDSDRDAIRVVLYEKGSPCLVPDENINGVGDYFPTSSDLEKIWAKQRELEQWIRSTPGAPSFTVRMVDRQHVEEPQIFRRGNPNSKGAEIARQLPLILGGEHRQPFQIGSGRLELAQGIISDKNPLTSRVWVNRIWQMHFGTGIVPTSSDFGVRATKPVHAELLDWLASTLIEKGWSTHAIQRAILLSDTYKQSTNSSPDRDVIAESLDPQNQLFWKRAPHRLSFEEFRDSLLQASGDLDRGQVQSSGPLFTATDGNRSRTLYGTIDRQSLPDAYRVFDFANPDMHVPQRSETMVSQQALFALNHPFIAQRAKNLIAKLDPLQLASDEAKVQAIFERVFQRKATPEEMVPSLAFIQTATAQPTTPLPTERQLAWQYGYAKLNIDSATMSEFTQFKTFINGTWQNGGTVPDPVSGWAYLTATGGHPGNNLDQVVVRRWTATHDSTVNIRSTANHEPNVGNGARFWVLSSKLGKLHSSELFHASKQIDLDNVQLAAGDALDFVVDINGDLNTDQYLWEIQIEQTAQTAIVDSSEESKENPTARWNSKEDFTGPIPAQLNAWEQFVQVLLLSNEFYFVP